MKLAQFKKPLLVLLAISFARTAYAACTAPAGAARAMIYNSDYHTYQFCNGTKWVAAGGAVPSNQYAAAGTKTVGDTTTGTGDDTGNANFLGTSPITIGQPGTVQSLSIYVATAGGNIRLGLYDATGFASNGWAGTKIAETAGAAAVAGWNILPVITPVRVSAGKYWLAVASDNNSLVLRTSSGPNALVWFDFPYAALPANTSGLSFSSSTAGVQYAFYATLTNSGSCSNPAGAERKIIYNTAFHTYQFCNGDQWINMGRGAGGGGGGCSNPAGAERKIMYNTDYNTYQFCNGTNWVKYTGATGIGAQPASTGYFVMSKSTWNGNLGGVVGADAKCLTELKTNTGWRGYADANARGLLVAAKVHAFMNQQSTSNNLNANTIYYFANANDATVGGAAITTDASGAGPGDNANWSDGTHFGGSYSFWENRSLTASDKLWGTSYWSTGEMCGPTDSWDTGTNAYNGAVGLTASTDSGRWYNGGGPTCDQPQHLICYVNP